MKRTIILSVLIIFSAIHTMAGLTFGLVSCERYGIDVLMTFSLQNNDNFDRYVSFDEHPCTVLDEEGNEYHTSRASYGTLKNYNKKFYGTLVWASEVDVPYGSNEIYNPVTVPAGVKVLVRIVVLDVPSALSRFGTIQLRGKNARSEDSYSLFCLNWNTIEDSKAVTINVGK